MNTPRAKETQNLTGALTRQQKEYFVIYQEEIIIINNYLFIMELLLYLSLLFIRVVCGEAGITTACVAAA